MGSNKIEPSSPKQYTGEAMANPWWKSRVDKERRGKFSQVSAQEDNAALTLSSPFLEYQLSPLTTDVDPFKTKKTETPPPAFLDNSLYTTPDPGTEIDKQTQPPSFLQDTTVTNPDSGAEIGTKTPPLSSLDNTLNLNSRAEVSHR